jgi:hypothetical protein
MGYSSCWDVTNQCHNRVKQKWGKGHFAHDPRAVTMKLWEPKRKCPMATVPTQVQTHVVVWSRTSKCRLKNICDPGPQLTAISTKFYSCKSSHMIKENKPMVVSIWSAMVSQFCVRSTFKRWFLKGVQVTMTHIHSMPCRNPCRLYMHLAFTYSVGPSSVVWSELGPAPPFHQWECSKCTGHELAVSCVKWP